jgi:putative transposase
MDRLVLSDAAWERMAPLIIGRPDQKGSTGRDNRMFVEGVLWIVRTGSPWRDLPEAFGDWNSVFRRFSRWSIKGVWWRIFEAMSDDPDFEYLIVDSTVVRAHQHAAGTKKGGLKISAWPLARQAERRPCAVWDVPSVLSACRDFAGARTSNRD